MKISEQWLHERVALGGGTLSGDAAQLAAHLTSLGLEVDTVCDVAPNFSGVVVGKIITAAQHPDADRLKVCTVDVGEKAPLTIVCGSPVARADIVVPVSLIGAVLPGDFKIKKSKLRGVESHGMICTAFELGLQEEKTSHIMELPLDAPIGEDFRVYAKLDDHVFDIELTPNRGDCNSVRGIARDLAAKQRVNFVEQSVDTVSAQCDDVVTVTLSAPDACPRYAGRVVRGIDPSARTPLWMQERLRRCGIRCIHPAVDVGNYVMLELGQPMHAFDLSLLNGDIDVRYAEQGESLALLDGNTVELNKTMLVIADQKQAVALAGIMGGESTAVSDVTVDIFLEAAHFAAVGSAQTSRALGVQSDSAYRFARGVDATLPNVAIERATQLLLDIAGGTPGPCEVTEEATQFPATAPVELSVHAVERLLGVSIDSHEIETILARLGFGLTANGEGWLVEVPAYRPDVTQTADLIEEVARLYGYDNVPATTPMAPVQLGRADESARTADTLRHVAQSMGYQEVVTYSFIDARVYSVMGGDMQTAVELQNPLSSDHAVLRASLLPGLLKTVKANGKQQQKNARLFELGQCFVRDGKASILQTDRVAMLLTGERHPASWAPDDRRVVDFFDMKSDVETLLRTLGFGAIEWRAAAEPVWHPGQQASAWAGETCLGVLGAIHPGLLQQQGIQQAVYAFTGEQSALLTVPLPSYHAVSKYPAVTRDLAFVMPVEMAADQLMKKIKAEAGNLLNSVLIFDIYQGEAVGPEQKSIALNLSFQSADQTLNDELINETIDRVVQAVARDLNVTLRA